MVVAAGGKGAATGPCKGRTAAAAGAGFCHGSPDLHSVSLAPGGGRAMVYVLTWFTF